MKRMSAVFPCALLVGLAAANEAAAQDDPFDVTLEVLDDVSEIDGVVLQLEDAGQAEIDRERMEDERAENDARRAVELEEEIEASLGEDPLAVDEEAVDRRELENEERDLARDFELELEAEVESELEAE